MSYMMQGNYKTYFIKKRSLSMPSNMVNLGIHGSICYDLENRFQVYKLFISFDALMQYFSLRMKIFKTIKSQLDNVLNHLDNVYIILLITYSINYCLCLSLARHYDTFDNVFCSWLADSVILLSCLSAIWLCSKLRHKKHLSQIVFGNVM